MAKTKQRILLFKDEERIKKLQSGIDTAVQYLQEDINKWNNLNIGTLNPDDLPPFHINVRALFERKIKEKISKEAPTVGSFRMSPEKLIKTLDLPDISELEKSIFNTQRFLASFGYGTHLFKLNENQQIEINDKNYQKALENCYVYTETDEETQVFEKLRNAVQIISDLNALSRKYLRRSICAGADNINLRELIKINSRDEKFEVDIRLLHAIRERISSRYTI